jgi:hypothetical protein
MIATLATSQNWGKKRREKTLIIMGYEGET